jgi:archaellum component FlaC
MNEIKLTDEYKLYKNGSGWTLEYISLELREVFSPRLKKNVETHENWKKYYGNLYRGLQGFSEAYYENSNSIDEVIQKVQEARKIIKDSLYEIKNLNEELYEEYRTVKYSN